MTTTTKAYLNTINLFLRNGYLINTDFDENDEVTRLNCLIYFTADEKTTKLINDFEEYCLEENGYREPSAISGLRDIVTTNRTGSNFKTQGWDDSEFPNEFLEEFIQSNQS